MNIGSRFPLYMSSNCQKSNAFLDYLIQMPKRWHNLFHSNCIRNIFGLGLFVLQDYVSADIYCRITLNLYFWIFTDPRFILLSNQVNASGQFVGVAEMLGPVDFKKDMKFWKLDKYNGFFPIKWHIIKDVPNHLFRHITLQNNENKPVTFSRDTQEVILNFDGVKHKASHIETEKNSCCITKWKDCAKFEPPWII